MRGERRVDNRPTETKEGFPEDWQVPTMRGVMVGGMAAWALVPVATRAEGVPRRKVRTPQGTVVGNAHRPVSGRDSATESKPPPGHAPGGKGETVR
jgi:hypothetical protein